MKAYWLFRVVLMLTIFGGDGSGIWSPIVRRANCHAAESPGGIASTASVDRSGGVARSDPRPNRPLIVHEWGTFTSLQNERGESLGGINVDDEPLPDFVHNLDAYRPLRPYSVPNYDMKAAPPRHPLVRMRLETPVIYFYPPPQQETPLTLDVRVRFRGGWLTQYYPLAEPNAPGLRNGQFNFGDLNTETVGSLTWRNLQVGANGHGPETDSPVWVAPREVSAATVTAESKESEKYLFYRGIGGFSAPIAAISDLESNRLTLNSNFADHLRGSQREIGPFWLVHVRTDGSCAFRKAEAMPLVVHQGQRLTEMPLQFGEDEFDGGNLHRLCAELHVALTRAGLYDAEATAMIETWRRAYFRTAGLRLFFVVPQAWTDEQLPLEISTPAELRRVMVARIELISPEQRQLLALFQQQPATNPSWMKDIFRSPNANKFLAGRSNFGDLGVEIPADYQTYLDLGRFRNAILLAEQAARPTEKLNSFIRDYRLEAYRWDAR